MRTNWYVQNVIVGVPVLPVQFRSPDLGRRIFLALSLPVARHRETFVYEKLRLSNASGSQGARTQTTFIAMVFAQHSLLRILA